MPVGDQHIMQAMDEALRRLDETLLRMTALTQSQLANCIEALERRDDVLAQAVIDADPEIDRLENEVSEQTVLLLTMRAPLADDLRLAVTALKMATDLERIADHAANTAKRCLILNQSPPAAPLRPLLRLGKLVQELLTLTLDAYVSNDPELAMAARRRDEEADARYSSLFREILTHMMEDPRTITLGSHLMFVAKNFERIGDHATNIAELTYYRITGHGPQSQRPKHDLSTSVEGLPGGEEILPLH